MSKELPYFKFFCSEWSDGDITLEEYRIQGLFINICSYYWSNNCDVDVVKLKKKFRNNKEDIDYIIKEKLIKVKKDKIVINFLIEQLYERGNLSNQNSINAQKRWDKVREKEDKNSENDTTASNSHTEIGTESMQYRKEQEKKRKELSRSDKVKGFLKWFNDTKQTNLGVMGKFKMLTKTDENNLFKLLKVYTHLDFKEAIPKMYASEWVIQNSMYTPAHFLRNENFVKYLNTDNTKQHNPNIQPAN